MSYYQEKLVFGFSHLTATLLLALGSLFSVGEARWMFATLASSVMTSFMLALIFRKPGESIQLVVGRSGLSILGGVFLTKLVVLYFRITVVETDVVSLMGLGAVCCCVTFSLAIPLLKSLQNRSAFIAEKMVDQAQERFPSVFIPTLKTKCEKCGEFHPDDFDCEQKEDPEG